MFYAYKLIGSLIVPPGLLCAVMALLAFVLFRKKGGKIIASAILLLSLSIYFISISVGANIITGPLEEKHQNSLPKTESPVAFLVLAGGSSYDGEGRASNPSVYSLERIYTAVRTADSKKDVLIFSGGNVYGYNSATEAEIMEECAVNMGWKGKTILENASRTTKENMVLSNKILSEENFKNVIVVTNAFHMPRSMLIASSVFKDINIYSLSAGRLTINKVRGPADLFPEAGHFHISCMGIKEWVGILAFKIFN